MIELEDARLTTPLQTSARKGKAVLLNAHLDGFTLTQLLDKVNQWCLQPRHKPFCLGYRGTFGTLLVLSKHLAAFFPQVKIIASIEHETIEPVAFRRLKQDHPNVVYCDTGENLLTAECFEAFKRTDAFVLAPYYDFRLKRFKYFFNEWLRNKDLREKKCVVADIVHARKYDSRGEYYLGSCIWETFDWEKLSKIPGLQADNADKQPQVTWNIQQSPIYNLVAVTSLSPLPKHIEVQKEVLASWKNLGLSVISGNSQQEIATLQAQYKDVEFKEVRLSTLFTRSTPRIYDLMHLGNGKPTLLINSDIAIYGDQKLITDALEAKKPFVGIRHNWIENPGDCEREAWGIDAFLLFPEQIKTFPDLDFAIGCPFWDYWVPYHLEQNQIDFDWLGEPYFYHQDHAKYWDEISLKRGKLLIDANYRKNKDWSEWRRSRPYGGTA